LYFWKGEVEFMAFGLINWNVLVKVVFITLILFIPKTSDAEWFGDIYLGMHDTNADDLAIRFNGNVVQTPTDSDTGSIFGGRIGYWFERLPWLGLAIDGSVFQVDFDEVDISIAPIAALLMARLTLNKSDEHPKGKYQPYIGFGPGYFFAGMSEFIPNAAPTDSVLDDSSWDFGFDGRVGIACFFWKNLGILLEYRYTKFSPTFQRHAASGTFTLEPTLRTNYVSIGVSFRF
jgi:hypothetical protein